jgi:hypothetical protein
MNKWVHLLILFGISIGVGLGGVLTFGNTPFMASDFGIWGIMIVGVGVAICITRLLTGRWWA